MKSFIVMTFALVAMAFYELSGGSDFEPRSWRPAPVPEVATAQIAPATPAPRSNATIATGEAVVTRASLNLTAIDDVPTSSKEAVFETTATPDTDAPADPAPSAATTALLAELTNDTPPEIELPSLESALRKPDALGGAAILRDIRTVTGTRVNMRAGPGTGFDVVGQLVEGDTVEVLEDSGSGWVRLKTLGSEDTGWMAAFLLSEGTIDG